MTAIEERLGLRRLAFVAVSTAVGPVAVGLAVAAALGGSWHVEGGAALLLAIVWPGSFALVGALRARTRPVVLGLLAAEALAIGSLFRSTDAAGGILGASFCLLVGAGGGALAARLVPMREPSPREDSVLATTAAAVCIVAFSVGVLGANRVGPFHSLRPHSEAVLPAPKPHCGSGERSSDIDPPRMSFSLLTPRVRPTDPVRVRYRLQFTNKQVDATRSLTFHVLLVARSTEGDLPVYENELLHTGYLRPDVSNDDEVQLTQPPPGCGADQPPPPGRYRAWIKVQTDAGLWVSREAPLTVMP